MPSQADIQHFYDHGRTPLCALDEGALAGLRHRTVIDGTTGAAQLALWQEEHKSGFDVPLHRHDCEEIITIVAGEILARIGDREWAILAGQSILIPEWEPHGFRVTSATPVRLLAIFGNPKPGIFKLDGTPSSPPWEGGATNHLQ
ncbi:cupin domain-containing protein [bacterium]|nr:cupin domain-containing protein [bacterium]